ncbi:MAG: hypothetical protein RL033_6992 [Pseudomonadota bacterium]|jgi:hypothetical protein
MHLPLTLLALLIPSEPHSVLVERVAVERTLPEMALTVAAAEAAAEEPPQKPSPRPKPHPKPKPQPPKPAPDLCPACGMG